MTCQHASPREDRPCATGSGKRAIVVCLALLAAGCSATYSQREVNYKPTEVFRAAAEPAGSARLSVRLRGFAPGSPAGRDGGAELSADIRRAEGAYAAVRLKETMQGAGHWGPVRVGAAESDDGDVFVDGKILASDGELLRLEVTVRDATDALWFTKEYSGVVDEAKYAAAKRSGADPYQFLYNRIANGIAFHLAKLSPTARARIRRVAELRFASGVAPEAVSGRLARVAAPPVEKPAEKPGVLRSLMKLVGWGARDGAEKETTYEVVARPADDDPRMARVRHVREREHLFVDAVDRQYASYAERISEAYTAWRLARLRSMNAVRQRESMPGVPVGKAIAIRLLGMIAGIEPVPRNDCAPNAATDEEVARTLLEGLGKSLSPEGKPIVLEVDGSTIELTGTMQAKHDQWRAVTRELYARGVGPIRQAQPPKPVPRVIEAKEIRDAPQVRKRLPPGPPLRIPRPSLRDYDAPKTS